ncbi:KH domain-containing protein [Alkalicoccus chagannorensis]|uniref:KH domain-containing protein n=1 Tax=Alkalicoccus chagannorensis TaxID=427072 RepID=UPI00042677E5|nr:KH domain-containing protein [Alkalicoccus chagannorensis]
MKELVETIAGALVDHPEDVLVTEEDDGRTLRLRLQVHEDDMGKVIGRQGRIAKAVRAVVYAAGTNQDKRVQLDIG